MADEAVQFKHRNPGGGRVNHHFDHALRRITIARPEKDSPIVLATNDFTSSALEIAQRYKERWGIELFFKWVKQHLKIKQFLGRTENAVRIQVLTALISYLLIALHSKQSGTDHTLWERTCQVRATLFQRPQSEEIVYRRRRAEMETQAASQGRLF
ncbi:MAG: transposase [Gammaproteobacteria bacterium]